MMKNNDTTEPEPPPEALTLEITNSLKNVDDWSFDIFTLADASNNKPLKCLAYHLFDRYGIIQKFKISRHTLEKFLDRMEDGYTRYPNVLYHTNLHGADITQTMHYMLWNTGLKSWLTDLEIFAALLASLMHDYEHKGTSNNFEVTTGSDRALLYNDRSVNENHHISAAFFLLQQVECNILSKLSRDEYWQLRFLIIEMVLGTDMHFHFENVMNIQKLISTPNQIVQKHKALSMVLQACDISNPGKEWSLHSIWVEKLVGEMFNQGDRERELGLPISPFCDRNNFKSVAETQVKFIDDFVAPTFSTCSDMLEYLLEPIAGECSYANANLDGGNDPNDKHGGKKFRIRKPWLTCLSENKQKWAEKLLLVAV